MHDRLVRIGEADGSVDAVVNEWKAGIANGAPIVTTLRAFRAQGVEGTATFAHTPVLRPRISLVPLALQMERFELRCGAAWYSGPLPLNDVFTIPGDWGQCELYVFGVDGATITLEQSPL